MTWFSDLRKRWGLREGDPPVIPVSIDGVRYEVSEVARLQAEANMAADPVKRQAVERLLMEQLGDELGRSEARRRYPKANWDD